MSHTRYELLEGERIRWRTLNELSERLRNQLKALTNAGRPDAAAAMSDAAQRAENDLADFELHVVRRIKQEVQAKVKFDLGTPRDYFFQRQGAEIDIYWREPDLSN